MFKIYFKNEMKRLGLKLGDICELLEISRPTLNARINNPKTFQVGEIDKLKQNSFVLPIEILDNKL